MQTRRQALHFLWSLVLGISSVFGFIGTGIGIAFARAKRLLLPKDTPMSELISKNPAKLDTSQLEKTPMDEFDVMGQTIYPVSIPHWRLELTGEIETPGKFTYEKLLALPAMERKVLLICPGFFAYNALWKGISMSDFLQSAGLKEGATHVEFSGPPGIRKKTKKYPIEEVMSGKVFLAYQVNGEVLPERHGYPLRLVAEDHYGGQWVKYVNRVAVIVD